MHSNLHDASLKREHSNSPRLLKCVIKKPVDFAKVDQDERHSESIQTLSENVVSGSRESMDTPSTVEDAPLMMAKDTFRAPRPSKKSHKRPLWRSNVDVDDAGDESIGSTSNQLVLYNPGGCNSNQDMPPSSDHSESYTSALQNLMTTNTASRVLPSVGAFTVQCADCFKWRLIPTKEIYEEIREHILQRPFTCQQARAWRPDITCDDPADISQDGSRLWAIDKPNIAQPPPGWERQLRIRGEGSTKFADVYYCAPSGKKLRSMVEVQKYLLEHPEYIEQGVKLSQFSFQIPRPLQENYVRKKPAVRMSNPADSGLGLPGALEPVEVHPLSWVKPGDEDLQDSQRHPGSCHHPSFERPDVPSPSPEKKKSNKLKIFIKHRSRGGGSSSTGGSVLQPVNEEL